MKRRSFIRRWALLFIAVVFQVLVVATVSPTTATAEDAQCSTSSESRQPVLLVHGFNSGPETWNPATRAEFGAVPGTCLDVFDYKNWSTHWVTDNNIGPALATRIEQLSRASRSAGGSGRIIIVAHSMGGLATRCALTSACNGGTTDEVGDLRELITFDTPNTGTWLRGTGVAYGALGGVASLLSGACYASFNGANPFCEQLRALTTSSATKAFTPGSAQLNALAPIPPAIPVYAVAAHVEAATSLFGWQSWDIGDAGDLVVKEDSALAEGSRQGNLGGVQTIDCGKINVLRVSGENCNHVTETNDKRFLAASIAQIKLAKQPAPAPAPIVPPTSVNITTPVPVALSFARGSAFDDYCVINWPTAPSYTSDTIQMVMGCRHVPESKYFYTEVVYRDPRLPVNHSTGEMHVVGTVIDVAHSAYGFNVLEVQADQITL